MCFAIPLKVSLVNGDRAQMEDGRNINLSLVGTVKKGDWLMVKSNLAVQKLSRKEAQAVRLVIKEVVNEI